MSPTPESRERASRNLGVIGGIIGAVRDIVLAIRDGVRRRRAKRSKQRK